MNYKFLENIYIASNGIIFDENMNVLKLSRLHDLVYTEEFKSSTVIELDNECNYIDLTHYYSFWPFAHRYDCLSRIRHIEEFVTNDTIFLLGNSNSVNKFAKNRFKEECELFGIKNYIFHPDNKTIFKIKKLIYPEWIYGEAPCAFSDESFIFCKNKYFFNENKNKNKLFLTRHGDFSRKLINFDFVNNFFKNEGFIILDGSETLNQTIDLFHNSEIIVGVHGGLFSNILFCNNTKKIIELFSKNWLNDCFEYMSKKLNNCEYRSIIYDSNNFDLTLNQNELNHILKII